MRKPRQRDVEKKPYSWQPNTTRAELEYTAQGSASTPALHGPYLSPECSSRTEKEIDLRPTNVIKKNVN